MKIANKVLRILKNNKAGAIGLIIFMIFVIIAIFADNLAPYDPMKIQYDENGGVKRLQPPSKEH